MGLRYADVGVDRQPMANSTGFVYHLDGSLFIHEPYIPMLNLRGEECMALTKKTLTIQLAVAINCMVKTQYLCQIRTVLL